MDEYDIKFFYRFLKENGVYERVRHYYLNRFVYNGKYSSINEYFKTIDINQQQRLLCTLDCFFDWSNTIEGNVHWNLLHILFKYQLKQNHKKSSLMRFNEWLMNDLKCEFNEYLKLINKKLIPINTKLIENARKVINKK